MNAGEPRILDRPLALTLLTVVLASAVTAALLVWADRSPERVLIGLPGRHDGPTSGERLAACLDCHVPFVGIPGSRCLGPGCHGELATGTPPRTGPAMPIRFHAALREEPCGSCHQEHVARSVSTSTRAFTHRIIPPKVRDRCGRCHSGRDVHDHTRTDAVSCNTCHGVTSWRGIEIDHARIASHACDLCHVTPSTEAHASIAGTCSDCHTSKDWNEPVLIR